MIIMSLIITVVLIKTVIVILIQIILIMAAVYGAIHNDKKRERKKIKMILITMIIQITRKHKENAKKLIDSVPNRETGINAQI